MELMIAWALFFIAVFIFTDLNRTKTNKINQESPIDEFKIELSDKVVDISNYILKSNEPDAKFNNYRCVSYFMPNNNLIIQNQKNLSTETIYPRDIWLDISNDAVFFNFTCPLQFIEYTVVKNIPLKDKVNLL
jgi:hypothetical protein